MLILRTILKWLTGPLTALGQTYMKGKADAQLKQIEAEETRNFIRGQLKEAILDDDYKRQQMVANILRRDRGDNRTSWIRPVTAVLALVFWLALTLSQIELGGNGILPIIWNVPPGKLGALFLGFPMGVLATFYIARPFEKFLIGRTQL